MSEIELHAGAFIPTKSKRSSKTTKTTNRWGGKNNSRKKKDSRFADWYDHEIGVALEKNSKNENDPHRLGGNGAEKEKVDLDDAKMLLSLAKQRTSVYTSEDEGARRKKNDNDNSESEEDGDEEEMGFDDEDDIEDDDDDDDSHVSTAHSDESEGLALLVQSINALNESLDAEPPPSRRSTPAEPSAVARLWGKHWLGKDDSNWKVPCSCHGRPQATLLDTGGLKLLKFVLVTALCLAIVHLYAELAGDRRDETYDLRKMVVFDGKPIVSDLMVFFLVGRLYEAEACDTLRFVIPLLVTAVVQSWGHTHLTNLQHSITPYDIKCEWTWQMHLLVLGVCLPLLGGLLAVHARECRRRGIGGRAAVEFVATLVVFMLPYSMGEDGRFFHLHHWYYAWFLGMHCNLHGTWWSDLARSILCGVYVNGVAIFGRDPVLTCSVTLYQSQSQECPYLGEGMGYGEYTDHDLGLDSGFLDEASSSDAIVCASDVTRWLWAAR